MSRFLLQCLFCRPHKLEDRFCTYSVDQQVVNASPFAVIERCWTSSLDQQNLIQIESAIERQSQDGEVFSIKSFFKLAVLR